MARRSVVLITSLVVLALVAGPAAGPAAAAAAPPTVRYDPVVAAPVLDGFRPPAQPWQAGNRGTDYDAAPGTDVAAAADGEVVFAGPVAGALHVTIRHADGLRTSYSFLAEISVRVGQRVHRGQPIGVAGGPVHVGVRTPDGTYLDPHALFTGALHPRVVLVPGADDGLDPLAERRSLLDVVLDGGRAALDWAAREGGDALALAAHVAHESDPRTHLLRAVEAAVTWYRQSRDCTPSSAPVPPPTQRRIAVVVSGLGTTSDSNSAWDLDTDALGYVPADVVRFSYRGGRAPGEAGSEVAPALDAIPEREFVAVDSQQPLEISADRLADLLAEVGAAEPGVPIDVLAHSQGGVVARLGVVTASADGRLPDDVENLVTVGSPHQGAPLATTAEAAAMTDTGDDVLAVLPELVSEMEGLDARLPAIEQLSETSPTLAAMREAPVPDHVRFTSLGASGDLVVPGTATADPQADTHVILPTALGPSSHGDLTKGGDTTREVALAVRGLPPTCQGLGTAVLAFGEAELVRVAETEVGRVLVVHMAASDGLRAGGDVVAAASGGG